MSLTFDRNAEMLVTCSRSKTCDLFNIIHSLSFRLFEMFGYFALQCGYNETALQFCSA